MLSRIARFCVRRRRLVVFGIWIPMIIAMGFMSSTLGSNFSTEFSLPASESNDVRILLEANAPARAGFTGQIVFSSAHGVNDPEVKSAMTTLFSQVALLDGVGVASPYDQPSQINGTGTTAFAQLDISDRSQEAVQVVARQIQDLGEQSKLDGMTLEYGGYIFEAFELPQSEAFGLFAAIIILVLAFGSVLAMGLPVGTALAGLALGTSVVTIVSNVFAMPDFTTSLVAMIGIGVGIDYALFIVTRYREGLLAGMSVEDAVVDAVDTSGRAVIFAGLTVIISILGLFLMGIAFARGLSVGAAIGVLFMMLASLTLLPALLAMAKYRINFTSRAALIALGIFVLSSVVAIVIKSLPLFISGTAIAAAIIALSFIVRPLRTPIPQRVVKPKTLTFWYRWSRFIQHRPWPAALGATALLLLLASPLTSIRLGFGDSGNLPTSTTGRRAYDMIAESFGPGFSGPLYITVQGDATQSPGALEDFVSVISSTDGIAFAQSVPASDDGSLVLVIAYPTTSPQDEATSKLIHHLRDDVIPPTGVEAKVGGFTAGGVDFASVIGQRMPLLFTGVLLLSFLLLMTVFRSVLVAIKAVIMNLLSIGAAYGVIVAIFQWGWGIGLIGVGKSGPIESWAPMMLFAIVFGLSMDYEVFLLSRVKEEYDRTGNNAEAVADGLAATARVITAAALIMVCVFAAFVLGYDRQLKLFGLGLATAVFIDATIVRMVLVPATMELLGDRNWWIPAWLNRILPRVHLERH
ncbi:MAG: MMPL family transporter [Ilumatobacteraceae bacterium]